MTHPVKRILVVDHQEKNRELLTNYLLQKNYHVANAESGPLGLALLPLFRPDLVILDYALPGMNGFEVIKRLKAWNDHLDIILIIEPDSSVDTLKAIELGARDYLVKPFYWEQLEVLLDIYLLLQTDD